MTLPGLEPQTELTDRQQAIVDLLGSHPDGVSADEAGAAAHAVPGPRGGRTHSPDERCEWCAREGNRLLRKLIALGVVKRRRGGGSYAYVLSSARGPAGAPIEGPGELPEGF